MTGSHSVFEVSLGYRASCCLKKESKEGIEMAQQVKAFAAKTDSLGLVPRTHMGK